jgi:integrase
MARTTITEAAVAKFIKTGTNGKAKAELRDGAGLVLRLTAAGSATWFFVYRVGGAGRYGTQRWLKIGDYPGLSVDKAKAAADVHRGKVALGADPAAELREAKRKAKAVVSVALDSYEQHIQSRGLLKAKTMMSSLRRGLGHLMKRDLAELDRKTLVDALGRIETAGARADFRKHMTVFFNWLTTCGLTQSNVMAGYRMPAATKADKVAAEEKLRVLTEPEVRDVWNAAGQLGVFGSLVQLGLATGLRRNELAALRRSWIDRAAGIITLPAAVMKSGKQHVVVITTSVAEVVDAQKDRGGDLVFSSERRHGGDTQLSGWSQLVKKLRKASGVKDVALHGLRRTFRSQLAELGVAEPVAEAMIAHARPDLVARYNKAELLAARRDAAQLYDGWLRGVIERKDGADAGNVVQLGAKTKAGGGKRKPRAA